MPNPEMTDYGRAQFATEVALTSLLKQAKDLGLDVTPVAGLMYLPTQEMTEDFKQACRTILLALTPPESHASGSNNEYHWHGEDY